MSPDQSEETRKWTWMMEFCKDVGVHPGDSYWWKRAEEEYNAQKAKEQSK